MSKKKQNFHYHYAEQYETRAERRAHLRRKNRCIVPPAALILSVVMLVLFGLLSVTFSVYVTDSFDDSEMPSSGGLVVRVKNEPVQNDPQSASQNSKDNLAPVGADVDLAKTAAFESAKGTVTVYFMNTLSWSNVYVYFYKSNYWDSSKGTGSKTDSDAFKYGPAEMTCIDSTNHIYAYTYSDEHSKYIAFTKDYQYNYDNFYSTQACYLNNFDPASPLFTPSTSSTGNYNSTAYYSSGTWTAIENGTISNPSGGSLHDVLKGTKVMFYYGDKWGEGKKYLNNGSSDVTSGDTSTTASVDNSNVYYVYTTQTSSRYYVSNAAKSSWGGLQMDTAPAGGEMYYLYNDGTNKIVRKTSTSTPTFASDTYTVVSGTVSSGLSATVGATSVIGKTNSVLYYYTTDNGATFSSFNPNNVSAMAVGDYDVYAVGYDGNIFARSSKLTFTVRLACVPLFTLANGGSIYTDQTETITLAHSNDSLTGDLSIVSVKNKSTNEDASGHLSGSSSPYTFSGAPAGTYVVTAQCSYGPDSGTEEIEVKERPACYLGGLVGNASSWGTSGTSMTYLGNNSNLYVTSVWLEHGKTYGSTSPYDNNDKYGLKIYYDGAYYAVEGYNTTNSNHYTIPKPTGVATSSSVALKALDGLTNIYLQTGSYDGYYTIKFNSLTKELTVEYPTSVQYFLLGMGTDANFWTDKLQSDSDFRTARDITDGTCELSFNAEASYGAGTTNGFKIYCTDGTYYGYQANSAAYTISRSNASTPITLVSNNSTDYNLGFTSWYSGNYTFSFDKTTLALSVSASPSRNVSVTSAGTAEPIPSASLTDNNNDTFTFSAVQTASHSFSSWSISGTSGTDYTITAGSTSASSVTIKVTSSTAVTVTANWVYRTYIINYHTVGGTLSTPTYTQEQANVLYKGTYTYNPTSTSLASLPNPGFPIGKSVVGNGWYSSTDYTTKVTSIPAGKTGDIDLWYYWTVTLRFYDNLSGALIDTQTTALGTATGVNPSFDADAHPAFTFTEGDFSGNWTSSMTMNDSMNIYINYRPKTQAFTIALDHTTAGETDDITIVDGVYNIPYGAKLSISATPTLVDYSLNSEDANYDAYAGYIVYYWSETADTVEGLSDGSTSSLATFSNLYTTRLTDYVYTNPNITSLMDKASGTYTIYAKAYYPCAYGTNGSNNNGFWADGDAASCSLHYKVDKPLQGEVAVTPLQKIYTSGETFSLVATLSLSQRGYNSILNASDYAVKTVLQLFKKSLASIGFEQVGDTNSISISADPTFTSTFAVSPSPIGGVNTYSPVPAGVNTFRIGMFRPKLVGFDPETEGTKGEVYKVDDVIQYTDVDTTNKVYTTVDTVSTNASRPIYLTFSGGILDTPSNYRIMLFYVNRNGSMSYQTAAEFTLSGTKTYRFMIPYDTETVSIGVFPKSAVYVLPEYANSVITYPGSDYCYGYTEGFITVKDGSNLVQKLTITARDSENRTFTVGFGTL